MLSKITSINLTTRTLNAREYFSLAREVSVGVIDSINRYIDHPPQQNIIEEELN